MSQFEKLDKNKYKIWVMCSYQEDRWIVVERKHNNYIITDNNIVEKKSRYCIGIVDWIEPAQHLYDEKYSYLNVVLTPTRFMADSIEELLEALDYFEFFAVDPWEGWDCG